MLANYHTHTWRCNHATGIEEEYIRSAISQGFQILGFSDHSPHIFPNGYYSRIRMRPEELSEYCDSVRMLRKQYSGKIEIPLGLELEYYPNLVGRILPVLRDAGIEYLLLGQHYLGNEMDEPYCGKATADVDILRRYCHQSMEAMNTGLFTYFAHPDLIHFVGDRKIYAEHIRHLIREARSCGLPLEVNMLGSWANRHYPNPYFWELAAEEGCHVVMGCDAHDPQHLRKPDTEKKLLEMIRKLDLPLLETVELKQI